MLGAEGAIGKIAWGEALRSSAQPQEYEAHSLISPEGTSDLLQVA